MTRQYTPPEQPHLIQDIHAPKEHFKNQANAIHVAHTPIGVLSDWWGDRLSNRANSVDTDGQSTDARVATHYPFTRVAPLGSRYQSDINSKLLVSLVTASQRSAYAIKQAFPLKRMVIGAIATIGAIQWTPKKYTAKRGLTFDWGNRTLTNSTRYGLPVIAALGVGAALVLSATPSTYQANPDVRSDTAKAAASSMPIMTAADDGSSNDTDSSNQSSSTTQTSRSRTAPWTTTANQSTGGIAATGGSANNGNSSTASTPATPNSSSGGMGGDTGDTPTTPTEDIPPVDIPPITTDPSGDDGGGIIDLPIDVPIVNDVVPGLLGGN